jgi:hypothetical protein
MENLDKELEKLRNNVVSAIQDKLSKGKSNVITDASSPYIYYEHLALIVIKINQETIIFDDGLGDEYIELPFDEILVDDLIKVYNSMN